MQALLRRVQFTRGQIRSREADNRIWIAGNDFERALRPVRRFLVLATVARDGGERSRRREIPRLELQGALMALFGAAKRAEGHERITLAGMREGQICVLPQELIDVPERLCGPVEALQT